MGKHERGVQMKNKTKSLMLVFFEKKKTKGTVINFLFDKLFGLIAITLIAGYWLISTGKEFRMISNWPLIAKTGIIFLIIIVIADATEYFYWKRNKN
jgi:hypothetical protein